MTILFPDRFIDDFIDWTEHNRINNRDSFNSFSNKDIAVIGSGNGGLVLVNYLTGKSPERAYKNKQAISFPKNIYWFGAEKSDDKIQGIPHHVRSIKFIPKTSKVEISYNKWSKKIVDHVLISGGYKPNLESVITQLLNGKTLENSLIDVIGETQDMFGNKEEDVLARQLIVNNQAKHIYFVGTSMVMKERKVSIALYAYRTQSFSAKLIEKLKK